MLFDLLCFTIIAAADISAAIGLILYADVTYNDNRSRNGFDDMQPRNRDFW
ncbi:hypothetical protein DFP73DRAFT_593544 [Morchella snyderi]|nr:hypothetical protein DFP73DRAFT_593544 [Morchella snyderi]